MSHPPHTHILTYLADRPWACYPETMQQMVAIALREQSNPVQAAHIRQVRHERLHAVLTQAGRPLDGARSVMVRDGIAILSIEGPIFRYADMFTDISGGATIDIVAQDFAAALTAPQVHAILLHIDSPGGETSGIAQFAQQVYAARATKPIVAFGSGMMASAAYWIGSAASEVVIDSTTLAGSIGTVMMMPNPDARSSRDIEIVSSRTPQKRPDIRTENGREYVQKIVDDLTDVFAADVAKHRGVAIETVYHDFGQGGVLVGQHASQAGLCDRIDTLEATLTRLAPALSSKGLFMSGSLDQQLQAQLLAQLTPDQALAAENATLKEQLQTLEAAQAQARAEHAKVQAATFAEKLITTQRFTPASRADLEAISLALHGTPQATLFARVCEAVPIQNRTQEQVLNSTLPLDRESNQDVRGAAREQVRAYVNGARKATT